MSGLAEVVELDAVRARRPRRAEADEPWLDKKGLGRHFAVCTSTVDNWARDGMPFEVIGGRRRFKVSACEAWHEARR